MVKTISLSEKAFSTLKKVKEDRSYSEVVLDLVKGSKRRNKKRVLGYFGKGGIDKDKIKELEKSWEKWSKKYA